MQCFGPHELPLVSTFPRVPSLERNLQVPLSSISQNLQPESRLHCFKHSSGLFALSTLSFDIVPDGYDLSIVQAKKHNLEI